MKPYTNSRPTLLKGETGNYRKFHINSKNANAIIMLLGNTSGRFCYSVAQLAAFETKMIIALSADGKVNPRSFVNRRVS